MEIKSFVLPAGVEFSEDEKKGLNALGDYIKGQFEEMVAGIKSQNEIVEAVKEEFGKLGLSPAKIEKLEGALKAQGVEIATMKKGAPKQEGHKTLVAAMEEVLKSEEFAAAYKDMRNGRGRVSTGEFALKLDTSAITNEDPNRTVLTTKIYADASPRNAFVQLFTRINVPDDKNRIMYNDASYTDGTGYAEEMTKHTNTDTATLTGKYRELAKLGSVLPFSAESAEDFGYFLAWAQTKAQQGIAAKLDSLLWDGDGVDASKPKHIYGLKASGVTAFNATTAGVAASVVGAEHRRPDPRHENAGKGRDQRFDGSELRADELCHRIQDAHAEEHPRRLHHGAAQWGLVGAWHDDYPDPETLGLGARRARFHDAPAARQAQYHYGDRARPGDGFVSSVAVVSRASPRYTAGYESEYLCRQHQHRSGRHRESNSRIGRVTHESER